VPLKRGVTYIYIHPGEYSAIFTMVKTGSVVVALCACLRGLVGKRCFRSSRVHECTGSRVQIFTGSLVHAALGTAGSLVHGLTGSCVCLVVREAHSPASLLHRVPSHLSHPDGHDVFVRVLLVWKSYSTEKIG
jgi:hypothetical protein